MTIRITSNFGDFNKELNRLKRLPGAEGKAILDGTLHAMKEEVKATVHVQSGRLKASTEASSHSVPHEWHGEIVVGNGLDYAMYEQERDGPHDFIGVNEHQMYEQMLEAVKEVLAKK